MRRSRLLLGAAVATAVVAGALAPGAPASGSTIGPEATYLVVAKGNTTDEAAQRVAAVGGTVVAAYDQIGVLVVRSTNTAFADQVAGGDVEGAAPTGGLASVLDDEETTELVESTTVTAGDATTEPLYGLQWDLPAIDVAGAHAVTIGSPDVLVGVLDSGIASNHPDLAGQVDKANSASCLGGLVDTREVAWSPTTSDHGTHVAGTIAAAINGIGIAGIAPGVKVASVKVVDDAGFIYPEAAVCGFLWAADHGMDLTNNSYFIDPWEFNCRNDPRQRPIWQAVQRALRYSANKGVLNIASAGNDNFDLQHKLTDSISPDDQPEPEIREVNGACLDLPAEAPGVLTVSATGRGSLKSYYSSYGLGVIDVAAPGGDSRWPDPSRSIAANAILSTAINTSTGALGWGYKQGTSMAAPHATGVAALALSVHPDLSPGALSALIERTSVAQPCPPGVYDPRPGIPAYQATCTGGGTTSFYGAGIVNALAVVS